jgi:glucose-1-phosphate adenylyltransferase
VNILRKDYIAIIMAGGNGSRLKPLTNGIAKPALPFGGKYRIIDFVLSNCINSGIDTIGTLTQYEPFVLNSYIKKISSNNYESWKGCIDVLPPHIHEHGGGWYKGTADAVFQNIEYISLYDPENVIILSADQVYKMDYSVLLDYHKSKNADITIAVTKVRWDETQRHGIVLTDGKGKVVEFVEKPTSSKSNLASMGIYIIKWDVLRKLLANDANNPDSNNDFGRNILPGAIKSNSTVFAYIFNGYWKDVGTLKSYWEANMDLLDECCSLDLYDPSWKIISGTSSLPPAYINDSAKVNSSIIGEGCKIFGRVFNSVLFSGVTIRKGAVVKDSIIMPDVIIEEDASIYKTIIGNKTIVRKGCVIGSNKNDDYDEITPIEGNIIYENKKVINLNYSTVVNM